MFHHSTHWQQDFSLEPQQKEEQIKFTLHDQKLALLLLQSIKVAVLKTRQIRASLTLFGLDTICSSSSINN